MLDICNFEEPYLLNAKKKLEFCA